MRKRASTTSGRGIWGAQGRFTGPDPVIVTPARILANHAFRATGITTQLRDDGKLEHAQTMANRSSLRTTGVSVASAQRPDERFLGRDRSG
jgi:hypothetical protein